MNRVVADRPAPPPRPPEPVPKLLRDLVHERTGIYFENDRFDTMLEKLEPRVIATGSGTYLDYYYILKYDEQRTDEWLRVMDAFSVQETYFWRESDQFRALVDHIVPEWFRKTKQPLRIWSSACATGEEPYSIVMALLEAGWGSHPIEVWASDASESALAKARAGIYRDRSFRTLPASLQEKYFELLPDGFRIRPQVSSRVKFHWANLVSLDDAPAIPPVEVIFCRNVFIYFSLATIKRVTSAFVGRLPPGGWLFLGASESLLKLTTEFRLDEIGPAFVYIRN
ncbi:MAG: methyltransferase, CheR-type [Verrucomicrobia bacterium]|nr:methyltransferase, CheR-type [Verrucomicrobiota bacterium]